METTLKILEIIVNLLIGGGLVYVGLQANSITKSNKAQASYQLKQYEREIFKDNYSKISKALGLVFRDGEVFEEAMDLFWDARDQARLELPQDIVDYTEELRKIASEAFASNRMCYDINGQPKSTHNPEDLDKAHKAVLKLISENSYEKYRLHMKIAPLK